MYLMRLFLIVLMTYSASLSGAMEAGHAVASDSDHVAMEHAAVDQPVCCTDNPERAQNCHVLSAIVPVEAFDGVAPDCSESAYSNIGLLLCGIEPSGLLDPPRTV
jgi:hypothetical protein